MVKSFEVCVQVQGGFVENVVPFIGDKRWILST